MKKLLLAVCLAGFVMPVAATADTYICKIKPDGRGDWIPASLAISHDPETDKVTVNDEFIMHYHKTPLEGKVATNNSKRITFTWTLPSVRNSAGQTALRFNFRASYLKPSHKMTISSSPSGYENRFFGRGRCTIK